MAKKIDHYTFFFNHLTFHYSFIEQDAETVHGAMEEMSSVAQTLGTFLSGVEPQILPSRSSLHTQGAYRMGDSNTDSVCDENSLVWSHTNLYFVGNGVIPTSTASNPTLTSMALALKASDYSINPWEFG